MTDRWAEWLRVRRDGGSAEGRRKTLEFLAPIRDQVLERADVKPGKVLLDVGCGDGLIGLGALDRGANVIFSDISPACLDDCRAIAGDEAEYRLADATDLGDVEADVVATRSVLIYVADKPKAFAEFFRVLRPGGRISIFEPINRIFLEERRRDWGFRDVSSIEELMERIVAEVDRVQDAAGGRSPMVDFDERDLLALAQAAGFVDLRLELTVEVLDEPFWWTRDWNVFLDSSPNPLAPTFREAMEAALSPVESERVTAVLRPQLEAGEGTARRAHAFLSARKPAGVTGR